MSILWCGGEDIDFVTRATGFAMSTSIGTAYRSSYSRGYCQATDSNTNQSRSKALGSAVTTVWASAQVRPFGNGTSHRYFGVGKNATLGGILMGSDNSNNAKLALWKCDAAGSYTKLATETGTSLTTPALHKWDMLIESFGASGRVRIYIDGGTSALIDYSGDLTWTGASDLDQFIGCSSGPVGLSEMILADEDTRPLSVVTNAPNAAGDANTMDVGTYTAVDEFALSDADIISSGTTGQVFQCNLTNLPAGSFTVKAFKVAYRGIRGATGITKWKVGVKTGGTIDVSQTDTMLTTWDSYERMMNLNPVTSGGWTPSEIDAVQFACESLT